ncbi:MAG: hypothetical protein P4L40_25030 [Terracidiphilus sp.]|nr:hypothetical protein [Terracidiphilus sp.]
MSFACGLLSLGLGSVFAIQRETEWLKKNDQAAGVLDVKVSTIRPREEDLGLVSSHPKLATAYGGGGFFLLGVSLCIAAVYTALRC